MKAEGIKGIMKEEGITSIMKAEDIKGIMIVETRRAYEALEKNLYDMIWEEQLKLGYRKERIRFYYPLQSLNRFLDVPESENKICEETGASNSHLASVKSQAEDTTQSSLGALSAAQMLDWLEGFADYVQDRMGRPECSCKKERFCICMDAQASEYVHETAPQNGFLPAFIQAVSQHGATMKDILNCFYQYASKEKVYVQQMDGEEFDTLVYFTDGKPDAYRYCMKDEGCHVIYHRFTAADYEDMYGGE